MGRTSEDKHSGESPSTEVENHEDDIASSEKAAVEGIRIESDNTIRVVSSSGSSQSVSVHTNEAHNDNEKSKESPDEEKKTDANGTTEIDEEGMYKISNPRLILLTFGLCVTTFLIGLDQMIIATAIPRITSQFHSLNDVGWYGSAYLLTTTSLQPSYGKIYSYFNVKWTFIVALFIFEVGSVICAVASRSTILILGRAIAGVGAAGLFSGGMTIIAYSVHLRHRAIFIAALSSMFGVSSIVGPILGGVFTDKLTWRWCFWINLPIGGVAIITVFFFFQSPRRDFAHIRFRQKIKEMDLEGAFFLICAVVCLLLALQWGGIEKPWRDSTVWGCILGFGLITMIFIFLESRKGDQATIPLRILQQRSIAAAALTLGFISMGVFTHIYFLPFYFQAVKGTNAEQSGIRCVPYLISNTTAALIVGLCVTIVGYYTPFIWLGTIVFAIGSGLLYMLKVDSPKSIWIGYQIAAGAGSGAAIQLPFIAVQTVLSVKDMPTGNAIAIFFNTLGGAVSISVAQNLFTNTLIKEVKLRAPGTHPALLLLAGATNIEKVVPPELMPPVLWSYNEAVITAFILPIVVACLAFFSSLLFEWKSIKGKNLMHLAAGA